MQPLRGILQSSKENIFVLSPCTSECFPCGANCGSAFIQRNMLACDNPACASSTNVVILISKKTEEIIQTFGLFIYTIFEKSDSREETCVYVPMSINHHCGWKTQQKDGYDGLKCVSLLEVISVLIMMDNASNLNGNRKTLNVEIEVALKLKAVITQYEC